MKIDDRFIKEALQTDADFPEEMKLFISEQLGPNAEKLPVRQARASKNMGAPREKRRGLIMGLVAIAAVAVLAILAIKLIPALCPSSETANPVNPGLNHQATGAVSGESDETYMKIPVGQDKLRWGMSEKEIIAVLGEPDERKEYNTEYNSYVTLTYERPIETALSFTSDYTQFTIYRGMNISEDELLVQGLNYIRFGSADANESTADADLIDYYGKYDEREDLVNPLEQLGVSEEKEISYRLYHWHTWELANHPELQKKCLEMGTAYYAYLAETTNYPGRSDEQIKDICADDKMLVEVRMSYAKDQTAEDSNGVSITLDAGRLMWAEAPVVKVTPEREETDPAHSMIYRASLAGLLEQQGIFRQLSSASGGKSFEIVSTPYVADDELLVNFKAVNDDSTYCTAFIKYRDDVDAESVVLSENKDVLVLDEYYIYNLYSDEAQDAYDLIYRKLAEVYETPDTEILRERVEAAIDAFFSAEPLFGPADDGAPEEEKEELRKHLKTITICSPSTHMSEPISWVIEEGLSFKDPRFVVGLQLDEKTPEELRIKYSGIWGDMTYFYMSVVYINGSDEFRARICPASIDLVAYETYKNIPFGAGKLRWGMSAAEIREALGEPDSWKEQPNSLALTYSGPMEEDLGIGSERIKSVTLYTDLALRLSENEFIQPGLTRIAVEFSKEFTDLMGIEGGIKDYFGRFDGSEEMDALPVLPKTPDDLVIKRYRWYAWELWHQPELREEYQKRIEAHFNSRKSTDGLSGYEDLLHVADDLPYEYSGNDDNNDPGADMLVELCCALHTEQNPADDQEDIGGYITLDARRYLIANSTIVIMLPGTTPDENIEISPWPESAGADTLPAPDPIPASALPPATSPEATLPAVETLPDVQIYSTYLADYLKAKRYSYQGLPASIEDCQLPEATLKKMTNEELLLTLLDYPYLDQVKYDTSAEHWIDDWGKRFENTFNGFCELCGRDNKEMLALLNRCRNYLFEQYGWFEEREPREFLQLVIIYLDDNLNEDSTIW